MKAFVAQPARDGRFAAAVVVQHIGGLSETMKLVARRVAALGFLCIVPALYHRLGDIVVDPVDSEPSIAAIRRIAVASLSASRVDTDMRATLGWLRSDSATLPGPRGIIGFGGGAGEAMRLAAGFAGDIRAFVSILGVGFIRLDDPASPHLRLGELSGGAYFAFAGNDDIIPSSAVENVRAMLAASGLPHAFAVHPGVRHGYCFADRLAYDRDAAEADWDSVRRLFAQHLSPATTQE